MSKCHCINCGAEVNELYKQYSSTVLKLSNCDLCQQVADKYIEYDIIIVIIDLILLRKEAYRHMLYNTKFQNHWKLAVMLQVMETYSEWTFTTKSLKIVSENKNNTITNNNSNFDLEFYKYNVKIMFRNGCFIITILIFTLLYNIFVNKSNYKASSLCVWKAIVLSNFGLFLLLPSLIWDNSMQDYHITFVSLYTTLSQLLAYTAVCKCSKFWSILVIIVSYNIKVLSNEVYNNILESFNIFYNVLIVN